MSPMPRNVARAHAAGPSRGARAAAGASLVLRIGLAGALAVALAPAHTGAQDAGPRRQALPPMTIADTIPPPPGVPNLAWLSTIELAPQPADSLGRAFMSGFRGAFAEGAYATERDRDGRPAASVPVAARFRMIEGTSGFGVWNLQVVVRYATAREICAMPADPARERREANRVRVTVAATPPDAAEAGARPIPETTALDVGPAVECAGGGRPTGGPREDSIAWWRLLGRAAGLLSLERLHHLSGDLDQDTRLGLGPVQRSPL